MDAKWDTATGFPVRNGYIALLLAVLFAGALLLSGAAAVFQNHPARVPLSGQSPSIHSFEKNMSAASLNSSVSGWHPPNSTWITDLGAVINGTGVHGFVFNSSQLPDGVPYGTYNWCNMPHVRASKYPRAPDEYQLEYVEVVSYTIFPIKESSSLASYFWSLSFSAFICLFFFPFISSHLHEKKRRIS